MGKLLSTTEQISQLLKTHKLSVTDTRSKILQYFFKTQNALSHGDIEKKYAAQFDRVTIYRTLQVFVEKGIIHTIPTADNTIKYALCHDSCTEGKHADNHVHFICNHCHNTYCLHHVQVPPLSDIAVPQGFVINDINYLVSGICQKCN